MQKREKEQKDTLGKQGEGEVSGRERRVGLGWVGSGWFGLGRVGLGRSALLHLIVNKRGVSSHADQVTAGNKRVI